jgi:hypothetical protein
MDFQFARTNTEKEQITELSQIIARGNHKLAEDVPNKVARLLAKDDALALASAVKQLFSICLVIH